MDRRDVRSHYGWSRAIVGGQVIDQTDLINQARSIRFLFYEDDLPSVVWIVIYLGCAITIGFSYFFGKNVFRAQELMCGFFSVLLGMTILAIIELAHPYQGTVTISDEPFRYALLRMDEAENYGMPSDDTRKYAVENNRAGGLVGRACSSGTRSQAIGISSRRAVRSEYDCRLRTRSHRLLRRRSPHRPAERRPQNPPPHRRQRPLQSR